MSDFCGSGFGGLSADALLLSRKNELAQVPPDCINTIVLYIVSIYLTHVCGINWIVLKE